MIKIASAVVLYNPDENIKENILSYLSLSDKVYVIDNSSYNNSNLLPKSKKIKYICNFKNLGVATAYNMAAKLALKDDYLWLMTMDQDSKFEGENLKKLFAYVNSAKNDVGLVCPWHDIITLQNRPTIKEEELLDVMSSGSVLNLKAYKKIGGFKDWMFIDNIDIDYCLNLNLHNYKVIRLNYLTLKHNLGDSKIYNLFYKKVVTSNHNYIRRYYITRNMLYTIKDYNQYFPEYCKYLKKCLFYNFKTILFLEKDKFRKIRSIYRGYKDYKNNVKGEYRYND